MNAPRVLVVFAHPSLERSRVCARLLEAASAAPGVTIHDLYERYPHFGVDPEPEQALLDAHDILVFLHPVHWYSAPALLKQWIDVTLEHGWAYGAEGTHLRGKLWIHAVSAGAPASAYGPNGLNRIPLRALFAPFEATARLCGARYLAPFAIFGANSLNAAGIDAAAADIDALLRVLPRLGDRALEFGAADEFDLAGALATQVEA
ncbi:MAG: NAD(P)H-dependent oxidoreductase [Myxococcales bacterium]|nr:NAD(P)H-dependent oxidoreductase [Myxococcales bacterium]